MKLVHRIALSPPRWLGVLALVATALAGAALAGCDSAKHEGTTAENRYAVTVSTAGRLVPAADGSYALSLSGLNGQVTWFDDRPSRRAGEIAVAEFVASTWNGDYGDQAPNASIAFGVDGTTQGIFATVDAAPTYDATAGSLTFPKLSVHGWTTDDPLGATDLTDVFVTLLPDCKANHASYCWSFAQGAATAKLEAAADGAYTLRIEGVHRRMFHLAHAPSTSSEKLDPSYLAGNWTSIFADYIPNAVLVGFTAEGALLPVTVELDQPTFDASTRLATYRARPLGDDPGAGTTLSHPVLWVDSANGIPVRNVRFVNECSFPVWIGATGSSAAQPACTTQADCSEGWTCNADTHKCDCGGDSACGVPGQECVQGKCECSSDAECLPTQSCNLATRECHWSLGGDPADYYLAPKGTPRPKPTPDNVNTLLREPDESTFLIPGTAGETRNNAIVWSGAVFPRTGCTDGWFCDTADCQGDKCAPWLGAKTPHTRAEFTFQNSTDFYDVSVIHGMNVPMAMEPLEGAFAQEPGEVKEFGCGNPGSPTPYPSLGKWTAGDLGCHWKLEPPAPTERYHFVPNGGAACASDSACGGGGAVCGLPIESVLDGSGTTKCGPPVGFWSESQICAVNAGYKAAPIDCTTPVPATDGNYGTVTGLFGCEGKDVHTCYRKDPLATAECCGCEDWSIDGVTVPSDGSCVNQNPAWQDHVLPSLHFLKDACPSAYTYPFDDKSATFVCSEKTTAANGADYQVTFCPAGLTGGVMPPTAPRACNCTSTVVATTPKQGIQIFTNSGTLKTSAKPQPDAGAVVNFAWNESEAPYQAKISKDTESNVVASCHIVHTASGCTVYEAARGDDCSNWEAIPKECKLATPVY